MFKLRDIGDFPDSKGAPLLATRATGSAVCGGALKAKVQDARRLKFGPLKYANNKTINIERTSV